MGPCWNPSVQHVLLLTRLGPLFALFSGSASGFPICCRFTEALPSLLLEHGVKEVYQHVAMAKAVQPTSAGQLNALQSQELLSTIRPRLKSLRVLHGREVPIHALTHAPALYQPALLQTAPGCRVPDEKRTSRKDVIEIQSNSPWRNPSLRRINAEANCLQHVKPSFSQSTSGAVLIGHHR